jgi:hypothetical protein
MRRGSGKLNYALEHGSRSQPEVVKNGGRGRGRVLEIKILAAAFAILENIILSEV